MRSWAVAIGLIVIACAESWGQPALAPGPDPNATPPAPTGVVTKNPVVLQAVAPEYPPAALAAGKSADVKVRIHIDEAGLVTSVDVLEAVGDGFDEAAVAAALQYVFDPAEIDGKPGAIVVETAIHFVLEAPRPSRTSPTRRRRRSPSRLSSTTGRRTKPAIRRRRS